MSEWQLIARRTFRAGVNSLWFHPEHGWAVSIRNRSYASSHPIPAERAPIWRDYLIDERRDR